MNDNNSELEEIKIDRQLRHHGGGGASIQMKDRRMSSLINWLWLALGGVAVSGIYWVATSITHLDVTLEKALVRMDYEDKRTDLNTASITQLQKDVAELQGKVYREDGSVRRMPNGN